MPAPPPYGVSSTVRWRSWVQSRRSWTCTSSRPLSCALPGSESPSGARYSGKIEIDVDAHVRARREKSGLVVDDDPAAGDVDLGHERGDEREEHLALRRTDHQEVLGRAVLDAVELADGLTVGRLHAEPDELVVVELLGVLGQLGGVDAAGQLGAAGGLGGGAAVDLREADHQLARVGAASRPRSASPALGLERLRRRRTGARARRCAAPRRPRP